MAVCAIVVLNVLVFVCEASRASQEARDRFVDGLALVPYNLVHDIVLASPSVAAPATLLTAQFLHASVLHLTVNVVFLAGFGPQIERLCGHVRFAAFYLACGVLGGLAQVSATPGSHVPEIGASGAIAGVLGAYALRFPLTPVVFHIPAVLVIGVWAAIQLVHGLGPVVPGALSERGGSVAYFAHIGGFLAGVFLIGVFTKPGEERQGPRERVHH